MRGAILYGAGDVRFDERAPPRITQPTATRSIPGSA